MPIPIIVFHGVRPGPVVTIIGATHGDELTGPNSYDEPSAKFTEPESALDPQSMAGTVRIVPVLNLLRVSLENQIFPDGRDLNRAFPGLSRGARLQELQVE